MLIIRDALFAGLLFTMSLPSCASLTPHENFKNIISHSVGKSIDDPPRITAAYPQYLISSKLLPNGHLENEYRFRGTCRYFFEIDQTTRKIVGWRFEGSESDCEIVP